MAAMPFIIGTARPPPTSRVPTYIPIFYRLLLLIAWGGGVGVTGDGCRKTFSSSRLPSLPTTTYYLLTFKKGFIAIVSMAFGRGVGSVGQIRPTTGNYEMNMGGIAGR